MKLGTSIECAGNGKSGGVPGGFTYMHAPAFGARDRFIAHDPEENFAGEFGSEEEARAAVERWNSSGGNLVRVAWHDPNPENDSVYNRGIYTISVVGTDWKETKSGLHGMEAAARLAARVRDLIAKHGRDTAMDFLSGLSA